MLDALFISKARIAILKTLLLEPNGSFYLRELAQKAGVPLGSAQVEAKRLTDAGVLEREVSGRQTYYRINDRCPIIPELRSLFAKTVGIADVLRAALASASDKISVAFIFGSFARGDIRPESDVDLFVVGSITLRQLTGLLKDVRISRVINPITMPNDEFRSCLAEQDHFVSTLMDSPKLFLVGGEHDLTGSD